MTAASPIVINGRDQKVVDATLTKLKAEHPTSKGKLLPIAADVGTAAGCKTLLGRIDTETSGAVIDYLICNVSIFKAKEFAEVDDDEWVRLLMSTSDILLKLTPFARLLLQ